MYIVAVLRMVESCADVTRVPMEGHDLFTSSDTFAVGCIVYSLLIRKFEPPKFFPYQIIIWAAWPHSHGYPRCGDLRVQFSVYTVRRTQYGTQYDRL